MGGPGLGGAVVAEKLAFPVTKLLLQLNNADEDDLCKGEPSWALQPLARCIEMDTSVDQSQYISTWAANTKCFVDMTPLAFLRERQHKVAFTVPPDVMLIAPLAITAACGGAELKAFREVLHYDNMMLAFSQTGQYEAAGTVWMCEVTTDPVVDTLSVSQVESAMAAFSKDAFRQSSTHAPNRRYSFDDALPVHVVDPRVAQRRAAGPAASGADTGVLMAQPLPLLAGGALVVGWYAQMQEALLHAHEDEVPVFKLLEAGLSVRSFRRASSRRLPQPPRTRSGRSRKRSRSSPRSSRPLRAPCPSRRQRKSSRGLD